MSVPQRLKPLAPARSHLRIWSPSTPESPAPVWRINGYRATLLVWTADEWARLEVPPSDARYHPSGFWCALRLD
jgi:hypothetical protein